MNPSPLIIPEKNGYIGRFAPSPSGPLHFGSLIAALGSYLQAKVNNGKWLVRVEDIDPPREQAGAAELILDTLQAFGLVWDDTVIYQSQRSDKYTAIIDWLSHHKFIYPCDCTRKQIAQSGGVYTGVCRDKLTTNTPAALRLKNTAPVKSFNETLRGLITPDESFACEDFIVHRKDGLFAYQLAVVVDDIEQGITEIVRGADLIEPTVRQLTLYQLFGASAPSYIYLPVAAQKAGFKLSKQNHAPALNVNNPIPELLAAMRFLGMTPPNSYSNMHNSANNIQTILTWAISHWTISKVPTATEILINE